MRREHDAGGIAPAGNTAEFCRKLIDSLEQDAARFLEPYACAGIITVERPKPRRLDARIIRRRPMMLVKRKTGGSPGPVLGGREITARD